MTNDVAGCLKGAFPATFVSQRIKMAITTSLVKMTVNCAKHKDALTDVRTDANGKVEKCPACEFLLHYSQKMATFTREINSLNSALEGFMKTNQIVAVDLGGKFLTTGA